MGAVLLGYIYVICMLCIGGVGGGPWVTVRLNCKADFCGFGMYVLYISYVCICMICRDKVHT